VHFAPALAAQAAALHGEETTQAGG